MLLIAILKLEMCTQCTLLAESADKSVQETVQCEAKRIEWSEVLPRSKPVRQVTESIINVATLK